LFDESRRDPAHQHPNGRPTRRDNALRM